MIRVELPLALVLIALIVGTVYLWKRRMDTRATKAKRLVAENTQLRELLVSIYGDALVAGKYEPFGELVAGKIRQSAPFKDDPRFKEI